MNGMNGDGAGRAIIQAGGKGLRLRPYTNVLPKPLMPVQETPIIEIIIRQLVAQGFPRITITLGHLGDLIEAVVGDGHQWGADVDFVWEDEPLGTMGAIRLVPGLDRPFLTLNGDLLTDFDFRQFMRRHQASGAQLSVGVLRKQVPISMGVFDLAPNQQILGFHEKPTLQIPCNMGIYALNPEIVTLIRRDESFGFDDLIRLCLARRVRVRAHPFHGLWLDIGRPEDYEGASRLLEEHRSRLLPERNGHTPARNGTTNGHRARYPVPTPAAPETVASNGRSRGSWTWPIARSAGAGDGS